MRFSLSHSKARAAATAFAVVALAALAGCSTDAADTTVAVTGTDDGCRIENDIFKAGTIDFKFTNQAKKVNELYVVRENDDVVGEVENVTTGTTRTLTASLTKGTYRVRCKPGQTGEGFESTFTVTGEGGKAQAAAERTITFDAVDFHYEDLDLTGISAGDTIRFEMSNSGEQPHEFEVLNPSGEPIGEVAAVAKGESGGATVTFEEAGTYSYQCILIDPDSMKEHTELGMVGTFEVAEPAEPAENSDK